MARFEGKTVVITGSARGQGAAEAQRFFEEGANVVLNDVLSEEGEALAAKMGKRAIYVAHDVTREDSWRTLFIEVERAFGRCDVLVNNAGIYAPATIADTTPELAEKTFRVNQLGTLLGMKHAIEPMKKERRWFDREHFVKRRAPRFCQCNCLRGHQVGSTRHDQGCGCRAGSLSHSRKFGASRVHRH